MNDNGRQEPSPKDANNRIDQVGGAAAGSKTVAGAEAHEILASVGDALYRWDVESDVLSWSANAADVLSIRDPASIANGRAYAKLVEKESAQTRFAAIMQSEQRDGGRGVSYRIQYCIRPEPGSDKALWLEDTGRWFAGRDGKPVHAHGVVRVINERYESERRLDYLARYDSLTGELNRSHLTEVLEKTLEESIRFRSSCGFLLIAIDNLARINKLYGFEAADQLIGAAAKRIRKLMRGKDTLGRFSGNKFGIVLRDCTPDDLAIAAERMLSGVRDEMIPTATGTIAVTVTIGGVTAPRHARTVAEVMARAQEALDTAKDKRRGSFCAYRPNIEREMLRRESVRATDAIVAALNERRIFLAFETVVTASNRAPAFYECLMRVRRADGSLLGANDVVPVAERLGLVRLLDHRVLELVVEEMVASPSLQASVNVSPGSTTDPDWWAGLELASARQCRRGGAPDRRNHGKCRDPGHRRNPRLCCPRQGSRLPHCDRRFRRRLHVVSQSAQARRRYSENRRRLRTEPQPIEDDRAFVRTLTDLAKRLKLATVAEWVQDEEAAKTLKCRVATICKARS